MVSTRAIAQSLSKRFKGADLLELLETKLTASELCSVLLAIHRARAEKESWPRILEQYARTPMFSPASSDVRAHAKLNEILFDLAERFEAVELAPVSPFGLNHLAGIDQNNVLSALRGSEVLADPTTQKALESARRRKSDRTTTVRFAGSHRLLRLQPLPKIKGYAPHFRIFTLSTAGRDLGDEKFESETLLEHTTIYLELFRRLEKLGWATGDRRVSISHTSLDANVERISKRVIEPLQAAWPEVQVAYDPLREQGRNYYSGYRLRIDMSDLDGVSCMLCDGGFTTWTQQLLSDRKERFFGSAIGSELLVKRFRPAVRG
jgi:hypothetical protein